MSVAVAKANLADALKQLRIRMEAVRANWDDTARAQFEKDFIAPLEAKVIAAAKGLDHVAELMAHARRDCGDDSGIDVL